MLRKMMMAALAVAAVALSAPQAAQARGGFGHGGGGWGHGGGWGQGGGWRGGGFWPILLQKSFFADDQNSAGRGRDFRVQDARDLTASRKTHRRLR